MQIKRIGLIFVFLVSLSYVTYSQENRTFSGEGNNLSNPELGAAHTIMPRANISENGFADGFSSINTSSPNAREISNLVFSQTQKINSNLELSDYVWAFGQFLDHDITLSSVDRSEQITWAVPENDDFFDSNVPMHLSRSAYVEGSGTDVNNPRQYHNEVSSFIDASMIYGSDIQRANWLRLLDGSGKMKTSLNGDFLPMNTYSSEYDGADIDPLAPFMDNPSGHDLVFVAGDIRANENPLLLSLHTLFVKEHNRMCDELTLKHPNWDGEQIYQRARKYIGAFIQSITYNEWLREMGIELPAWNAYDPNKDPSVSNFFATAAFRMGHTLINSNVIRLDNNGQVHERGNIILKDAYFDPSEMLLTESIEPFLKGMGTQMQQELDCKVIDDVRNFLFSEELGIGQDLVSINIMRGRERGLPDFNSLRNEVGLAPVSKFSDITSDVEAATALENIYGSVDSIDAWVGMLTEDHMQDKMVGELIWKILKEQFKYIRDGDRFYFENDPAFSDADKFRISNTTLHDIIMRNTEISLMQSDVFKAMPHTEIPDTPDLTPIQLEALVYPNPITEFTTIKVYSDAIVDMDLQLFNATGLIVTEQSYTLQRGENFLNFPYNPNIIRGVYVLHLVSGEHSNVIKVVKE